MSPRNNKVVLFIDMLGFGQLVETCDIDVKGFRTWARPASMATPTTGLNVLTTRFVRFHYAIQQELAELPESFDCTAIRFSDCAFIALNSLWKGIEMAVDIMCKLVFWGVPVRVGVGFGSFAVIRFMSDTTLAGSDHAAQFLGTAVVRAHAAESCGIKGMRILLHPTASALIKKKLRSSTGYRIPTLACVENEIKNPQNRPWVKEEIDYLSPQTRRIRAEIKWSVRELRRYAPQSAFNHYDATLDAMERMLRHRSNALQDSFRVSGLPAFPGAVTSYGPRRTRWA
jgi:hypothetical protein